MNFITIPELLANKDNYQIIDIREDYEFEDFNIGGINIPMAKVFSSIDKINTEKPIVFCCNSGKKSKAIIHTIKRKLNFENIYSLEGGITAFKDLENQ